MIRVSKDGEREERGMVREARGGRGRERREEEGEGGEGKEEREGDSPQCTNSPNFASSNHSALSCVLKLSSPT